MPEPVPLPTRYGVADSVEDYLAECRARGLRSASPRGAYAWPLRSIWLPWCAEHEVHGVDEVDQRVVHRFVAALRERGGHLDAAISPHSINAYAATVARWLRWAQREGQVRAAVRVTRVRAGRVVREIVTEDEYERMLRSTTNDRDRLLLQLLWDTGLRADELLQLRLHDAVRYDGRWFLRVLSPWRGGGAKDSRERLVPLPRVRELRRFIDGPRARMEASSDHVFLSLKRDGRRLYHSLTVSGLEQLVRTLAEEAGIEHRVYPHLFRHTAVTRWLRQGLNPLEVAAIVGHSSLAMIQRHYSQLDHRDAYDALARVLVPEKR